MKSVNKKLPLTELFFYLKVNEETTNHIEIQQILFKLISENRIEVRGKSYFIYRYRCSNCNVYFLW